MFSGSIDMSDKCIGWDSSQITCRIFIEFSSGSISTKKFKVWGDNIPRPKGRILPCIFKDRCVSCECNLSVSFNQTSQCSCCSMEGFTWVPWTVRVWLSMTKFTQITKIPSRPVRKSFRETAWSTRLFKELCSWFCWITGSIRSHSWVGQQERDGDDPTWGFSEPCVTRSLSLQVQQVSLFVWLFGDCNCEERGVIQVILFSQDWN